MIDAWMRISKLLRDDIAAGQLGWWYLSFADEEFLGAVFVRAFGMTDAIRQAHLKGINPGGSVRAFVAPDAFDPPAWARTVLLSRQDIQRLDDELGEAAK